MKRIWFIVAFLLLASLAVTFAAPPIIDAGIDHRLPTGTGIDPASWRSAMDVFQKAETTAAIATVAGDLSAHSNAVTAVHGAAAGTRFLTASETLGIDHGGTGQTASSAAADALGAARLNNNNTFSEIQNFNAGFVSTAAVGIGTGTAPGVALGVDGKVVNTNASYTRILGNVVYVAKNTAFNVKTQLGLVANPFGRLSIYDAGDAVLGEFVLQGASNVVLPYNASWTAVYFDTASGTSNMINVIADGGGAYSVQVTLTNGRWLMLDWIGLK